MRRSGYEIVRLGRLQPDGPLNFTARITTVVSGFPQWSYSLQRVVRYNSSLSGVAKWVTDGVTISGVVNTMETPGTPPYTYGAGCLITSASGQVNSTACVIQSIGVGAVVDVTAFIDKATKLQVYRFSQSNFAQ